MITIHHLGVSQSERIIWLFEELGLPYELKIYKRAETGMAPGDYKALHPMGIAPVIDDGALRLAESGAIIEYVINKYGNGKLALPPDHPNYSDYLFWFHFANGTFMPAELSGFTIQMMGLAPDSPRALAMTDRSRRAYAYLEQRLGEAPYVAGPDFTAADLILFFPLTTMRAFSSKDLSAFPNIRAYLQRVGSRPAYIRAMEKGDPEMKPVLG